MKQDVLKQIKDKSTSSGGHCGLKLVDFNIPLEKLKPILNELFTEGLITVHDNQHGKLIKLKNTCVIK